MGKWICRQRRMHLTDGEDTCRHVWCQNYFSISQTHKRNHDKSKRKHEKLHRRMFRSKFKDVSIFTNFTVLLSSVLSEPLFPRRLTARQASKWGRERPAIVGTGGLKSRLMVTVLLNCQDSNLKNTSLAQAHVFEEA